MIQNVTFKIPRETRDKLKIAAALEGISMVALVAKLLVEHEKSKGKK